EGCENGATSEHALRNHFILGQERSGTADLSAYLDSRKPAICREVRIPYAPPPETPAVAEVSVFLAQLAKSSYRPTKGQRASIGQRLAHDTRPLGRVALRSDDSPDNRPRQD